MAIKPRMRKNPRPSMTLSRPIQHYSTATAKVGFFHHALRAVRYPGTLFESRGLLWNFARRDLLSRFRGSSLGVFWVLVQPLFMFAVYFAVFGILFAPRGSLDSGPDPFFAIYLFSGILAFGWINEGTAASMASITTNNNLVKKVRFPCELLPLVPVIVGGAVYLVGCCVLITAGLILGQVSLGWHTLWWPVLFVLILGFVCGLGLLLSAANVFVRDISHLYRIVSMAWFFLTPNFWPISDMRAQLGDVGLGWFVDLLMWNPAVPFVLAQRQVFGVGHTQPLAKQALDFPHSLTEHLLMALGWTLFALFVGYGFFKSRRHKFADLV